MVGAGPAGTVTAMLLAQRGYDVDVIEKRGRPTRELAAKLRSYILALNPRCPLSHTDGWAADSVRT